MPSNLEIWAATGQRYLDKLVARRAETQNPEERGELTRKISQMLEGYALIGVHLRLDGET